MFEKCKQCSKRYTGLCPHINLSFKERALLDSHCAPVCQSFVQAPPPQRMTNETFAAKQKDMLQDLPAPFHMALATLAWEQGHSSGYEEVLSCLSTLIDVLEEPIRQTIEAERNLMAGINHDKLS